MEYFEEPCSSEVIEVMDECCDVCSQTSDKEVVDCQKEMSAIVQTVKELPSVGEKRLAHNKKYDAFSSMSVACIRRLHNGYMDTTEILLRQMAILHAWVLELHCTYPNHHGELELSNHGFVDC